MATPISNKRASQSEIVRPYLTLDAWRGFAALWVVMVHSCAPVIGTGGDSPWLAHQPLYAFSAWGQLGVSLFFVISGYCIASAAVTALRKPRPLIHFLRSRVRRIYPPYFFATTAAVLSAVAITFLVSHGKLPVPHHHGPSFFGQRISFYLANAMCKFLLCGCSV
jgi:exopolysaccharide production protein ExoZ